MRIDETSLSSALNHYFFQSKAFQKPAQGDEGNQPEELKQDSLLQRRTGQVPAVGTQRHVLHGSEGKKLHELPDAVGKEGQGQNGALTEQLKNKGFHVIGIDASEELLNIARRNYPDTDFIKADATSFSLDESVDAVFSNAVFHWIDGDKQSSMLHCVYNVLRGQRPSGQA